MAVDVKQAAKRAFQERMQWIEDVLASGLADELKVLAVRIGLHKNDRTGQCDPAVATLATGTGNQGKWARRTLQRQLRRLRSHGWIDYPDNRGGKSKSTPYTLTKPRHLDVAVTPPLNRDTESTKPRHLSPQTATPRSRTNLEPIEPKEAGSLAPLADGELARPQTHGKFSDCPSTEEPPKEAKVDPKVVKGFDELIATFNQRRTT